MCVEVGSNHFIETYYLEQLGTYSVKLLMETAVPSVFASLQSEEITSMIMDPMKQEDETITLQIQSDIHSSDCESDINYKNVYKSEGTKDQGIQVSLKDSNNTRILKLEKDVKTLRQKLRRKEAKIKTLLALKSALTEKCNVGAEWQVSSEKQSKKRYIFCIPSSESN